MLWSKIRSVWFGLFRRSDVERDMAEELQFHIEARTNDLAAGGLDRVEALRRARLEFGSAEKYKEEVRRARGLRLFDELRADFRYGVRSLGRTPALTAVAVISLGLGIGANSLIFSVLDSTLLKPLGYRNPERLAVMWSVPSQNRAQTGTSSVSTYFAVRDQGHSFESVGAFNGGGCGVKTLGAERDGQPAERLFGQCFSPALFEVLGIKPLIGRTFTDAEDQVGNVAAVTLISHGLWQRRFGGDPDILGKTLVLNRAPTTIIGVLPPDFELFKDPNAPTTRGAEIDFVIPLELTPTQVQSKVGGLTIAGRLKRGISMEKAQAAIDTITAQLAISDPERHQGLAARLEPIQRAAARDYRSPLLLLQGAVVFVLLIGCANVAGLLLARMAGRRNEVALRMALGAGRWRIVRQLVTEGLPLAILGGVFGILICAVGIPSFAAMAPADFPRLDKIVLDNRVFGFTAFTVLVTSVLFTIVPALHGSNVNLIDPLKESGRAGVGGGRRRRLRTILVTGQIAFAIILLTGAGLMIHSFVRIVQNDLGADPNNLLMFDFRLTQNETITPSGRYRGLGLWNVSPVPAQRAEKVLERLQQLPGILSVAAVNTPPFLNQTLNIPFVVEGQPLVPGNAAIPTPTEAQQTADSIAVTRGFFAVMKIPLLQGRDFNYRDTANAPLVAIINETMRRKFFHGENPIGKHVTFDAVPDEQPREIVGVVGDTAATPLQRQQTPAIYVPHVQQPSKAAGPAWGWRSGMTFVIRTTGDPLSILPAIKSAVAEIDRSTPVADARTAQQVLDNQVRNLRLYMVLFGIFGAAATILAATGIYGVMAYSVAERTREIGIRIAMGGTTRDVLMIVVREATAVIGAGLVLGLSGALALTHMIRSQIFGVTVTDPATYGGVSIVLLIIAAAACLVPARRAATVDPTVALKYE